MTRISIIGGGIAGLSAAFKLLQLNNDYEIDIYDIRPQIGGILNDINLVSYVFGVFGVNFVEFLKGILITKNKSIYDLAYFNTTSAFQIDKVYNLVSLIVPLKILSIYDIYDFIVFSIDFIKFFILKDFVETLKQTTLINYIKKYKGTYITNLVEIFVIIMLLYDEQLPAHIFFDFLIKCLRIPLTFSFCEKFDNDVFSAIHNFFTQKNVKFHFNNKVTFDQTKFYDCNGDVIKSDYYIVATDLFNSHTLLKDQITTPYETSKDPKSVFTIKVESLPSSYIRKINSYKFLGVAQNIFWKVALIYIKEGNYYIITVLPTDFTTKGINGLLISECNKEQFESEIYSQLKIDKNTVISFEYPKNVVWKNGELQIIPDKFMFIPKIDNINKLMNIYTKYSNVFVCGYYCNENDPLFTVETSCSSGFKVANAIHKLSNKNYF